MSRGIAVAAGLVAAPFLSAGERLLGTASIIAAAASIRAGSGIPFSPRAEALE
jgi:hypothetical protein